jgi:hypothetical protein
LKQHLPCHGCIGRYFPNIPYHEKKNF